MNTIAPIAAIALALILAHGTWVAAGATSTNVARGRNKCGPCLFRQNPSFLP
jgi:hypothetical protein